MLTRAFDLLITPFMALWEAYHKWRYPEEWEKVGREYRFPDGEKARKILKG
jgi:hypothetical protein